MVEIFSQALPIFLFLSIFYFNLGSGQLICWSCDPCPVPFSNTSSSVSAVTCTTSQTICVTNTVNVLGKTSQVAKGCVSSCTPSSSNFFGQGAFVDCCNTNYCNLSIRNQLSLSTYSLIIIVFTFNLYYQTK